MGACSHDDEHDKRKAAIEDGMIAESEESQDQERCIVVRTSCCKAVVFVGINHPRVMNTETFKEIGEMIADGCTVEHTTVAEFRKLPFGCKCEK